MTQISTQTPVNVAIVVGRWQLPHLGHATLLNSALALAEKVIVVIGSAYKARDVRNPFNYEERMAMVLRTLAPQDRNRVQFVGVRDYYDNARWTQRVQSAVSELVPRGASIAMVGYKKDHTSEYLDEFPSWKFVGIAPQVAIDATSLRNIYFSGEDPSLVRELLAPYVTPEVLAYLDLWRNLPAYQDRVTEHAAVLKYRKDWTAPWYQTADAVVQIGNHVLLVQRKGPVGKDLWALPGGFVNPNEEFLHAALRELDEETSLGFLDSTLLQALKSSATFGHALRSPRGRIVTQMFHFAFGHMDRLPELVPRDDVKAAKWVLRSELPSYLGQLFEDHDCALDHFIGIEGF